MSSHDPGTVLEVSAGPHDRRNAVVTWTCEGDCDCGGSHAMYEVDEAGGRGAQVPCQCVPDCGCGGECNEGCGELAWVVPELKAGETRRYVTGEATGDCGCGGGCGCEGGEPRGVSIDLHPGEKADFLVGGELFTSYITKNVVRPYCWPVIGPGGAQMTELPVKDHPHHRSMYVAMGSVNGVNNWDEMEGHGWSVNQELEVLSEGPVFADLLSVNDWLTPDRSKEVLQEITRIRVYNFPGCCRLMDWDITWFAGYGGVFFGDTKEAGTLSVRLIESMHVPNGGTIRNSYGGINDDECWGKRAQWVDYYGPISTGVGGLTIMDHPDNFRHPTYWHVRGYGLFTANQWGIHDFTEDWSKRGDHVLEAGDALNFLFRVYIHEGDTCAANVAGKYHDFINPPTVKVVG